MLLTAILKPTLKNITVWLNTCFLLALLFLGSADAFIIVMIYFFETLLIGIIQIIKMLITGRYGEKQRREGGSTIGMILFFIVHYSMFVGIQSVFVFLFFDSSHAGITDPANILSNFSYALSYSEVRYGLLFIFCGLIFQLLTNFVREGKYNTYSTKMLMFQPYLRIFIQQFAVIISGFFIIFFPNGIMIALLLILFRLLIDLTAIYIGDNEAKRERFARYLTQKEPEKENDTAELMHLFFD